MIQGASQQVESLKIYRTELKTELKRILSYWITMVIDKEDGGFYGKIGHDNKVVPGSPKGSVLNSRILWAFSSAYNLTRDPEYLATAQRAFDYISNNFIDIEFGGVYWMVDHAGKPFDTKKQTYASAFAIYGLAEFYKTGNVPESRQLAINLYNQIITHTIDKKYGGYFEALSRHWEIIDDSRLSDKDANEKKSMNTHLHVIEGFANLYSIWPDDHLKSKIEDLHSIFLKHIINPENDHLHLFFEEDWTVKSTLISYGHDIEAAWLLQETAEIIRSRQYTDLFRIWAIKLAKAASEGLDNDGGLWYEFEPANDHLQKEKHSWSQAEAMVGYFNVWQLTGDSAYLRQSLNSWQFIKAHIADKKTGEWVWGVFEDYTVMEKEDKAGLWKCPYHNSRACIEMIQRISNYIKD